MNEMNLPPFYPGQKVVYITGKNMPKDSVHTVLACHRLSCGCHLIDIGVEIESCYAGIVCRYHSHAMISTEKNLYEAGSFRPLEEMKFPLITYSKVLEETLVSAN